MAALNETVIREVTTDVWTFSKPFTRWGFLPFGGRSTAVKLSTGDVWLLASTPITDETKSTLDRLGPVKYIVAPDAVHYMYIHEYKKAYPSAKVIGVEPLIEKVKNVTFDGAYGKDPEGTQYGFESEIHAQYFSGFANKDVAFLHAASKTLIQADLLMNLPPKEQYSKSKKSSKFPIISGLFNPFGGFHKNAVWGQGVDKEAMTRDAKVVSGWDFTRIIPCHGDVLEGNGKEAWNSVYELYLKPKKK